MDGVHRAGASDLLYATVDLPPGGRGQCRRLLVVADGGPEKVWQQVYPVGMDERCRLRLAVRDRDSEEPVRDAHVARCFPWSLPDRYLSIRDKDGNELHLFGSIDEVPEASRQVVMEELAAQEFVPRILRVHEIDDSFDIIIWKADTDCGPVEFQVKHDEDIRLLGDNYVIIKDHSGMLFEVPDLDALDEKSRALIEDRLS